MQQDPPAGVDAGIADAITTPNLKVIVAEWAMLGDKVMTDQLVHVSTFGHLLQPDHAVFQNPGGLVDQWQAFADAHRDALREAEQRGGLSDMLMPWAYPQFDRFVLHFMAAAIRIRHGTNP